MLEQVEQEAGAPLPVLLTRIGVKAMERKDHHLAVNALSKAAAYTYPRMQPTAIPDTPYVITPPLIIGDDGKATIPLNWPHPTIRITTPEPDDPPSTADHVLRFR